MFGCRYVMLFTSDSAEKVFLHLRYSRRGKSRLTFVHHHPKLRHFNRKCSIKGFSSKPGVIMTGAARTCCN